MTVRALGSGAEIRDFGEWIETRRESHRRRPARRARIPWVRSALGSAIVVMGLVELARTGVRAPDVERDAAPVRQAIVTAPPPAWQPLERASPLFAAETAELRDLPVSFEARRHASGGREDKLAFGVFESEAPYVRLALFRGSRDPGLASSFFVDLARRAGDAGLGLTRMGQASGLTTKFGEIETAEVVLSDSLERRCLGFRFGKAEAGFSGHGWYCGAAAAPPEPRELACLVDGLRLGAGVEDQALAALFAEAERRRGERCGPRLAESKRKTT